MEEILKMASAAKLPKPAAPMGATSYRRARPGEDPQAVISSRKRQIRKATSRAAKPAGNSTYKHTATGRPVGRPAAADRINTELAVGDRFKILGRVYEITELTQHLVFLMSCDELPQRPARMNRSSLVAGLLNWLPKQNRYEFKRVKNT